MRFVTDRCVQCNSPDQPTGLSPRPAYLDEEGHFHGTHYWFCSFECFKDAVKTFTPKKYQHETAMDDPEVLRFIKGLPDLPIHTSYYYKTKREQLEADIGTHIREWETAQQRALDSALEQLTNRLHAEFARSVGERLREEQEFEELIKPQPIPPILRFEHTHILGRRANRKRPFAGYNDCVRVRNYFLNPRRPRQAVQYDQLQAALGARPNQLNCRR